jgi:hypothetical protein
VLSWRRSAGERRQQVKWLASGAVVTIASAIIAVSFSSSGPTSTLLDWADNLAWFGLAALPVSMGVGILRYRLYEIDRLISRTLAYAAVTALLVGVYAGLVLLSTHVLSLNSPVAVAASTLAAAALFNPLRRRVQRFVDCRFNRLGPRRPDQRGPGHAGAVACLALAERPRLRTPPNAPPFPGNTKVEGTPKES